MLRPKIRLTMTNGKPITIFVEQLTAYWGTADNNTSVEYINHSSEGSYTSVIETTEQIDALLEAAALEHMVRRQELDYKSWDVYRERNPEPKPVEDADCEVAPAGLAELAGEAPTGGETAPIEMTPDVLLHLILSTGGLMPVAPTKKKQKEKVFSKAVRIDDKSSAMIFVDLDSLNALEHLMLAKGVIQPRAANV